MFNKDHPANQKRQKYQLDKGNQKTYHMDLDETMGRSPSIGRAKNRFGGREFCE